MTNLKVEKIEQKDLEEAAKILSARHFGDAVAKRIKELKWRQQDLADAIFTGQPVISQIVRGDYQNLTLDWVTRLAKALKMSPVKLASYYWKDEEIEISEQNHEILEQIRELLTEYYQIGGHQQDKDNPNSIPPSQSSPTNARKEAEIAKADQLFEEQTKPPTSEEVSQDQKSER
jgi:transcriptional regulator with XRE-family HTH domain